MRNDGKIELKRLFSASLIPAFFMALAWLMFAAEGLKVVLEQGGNTVAIYEDENQKKDIALELKKDNRASFIAKADYSNGSKVDKLIKGIIDSIETKAKISILK